MPSAPRHPCRSPGCSALIPAGQGAWCPAHYRAQIAGVRVLKDRHRGSAADRGYGHEWQRQRRSFLARWPMCMGVLLSDLSCWTRAAAEEFHYLRESDHMQGRLLLLAPYRSCVSAALKFLQNQPIYRIELWDLGELATEVDHIIPHQGDEELRWAEWNWQPLTKRAHSRKTATEARTFHRQNT